MNSHGNLFFHLLKLILIIIIVGFLCVIVFQKFLYISSEQAFINTKLITMRSPIEGEIHLADAAVGSFVNKDHPVFEVFNPRFGNTNSNSQHNFLKARIDKIENDIARDTLNAERLETDHQRYEKLKDIGAVSLQEFDEIDSSLKILKTTMQNKKTQLTYLKERLEETSHQLDLLKKSVVSAPSHGVIWAILKKDGEHVDANDEVMQLIDPGAVWIDAFFSERYAEQLKPGDQVLVNPIGSDESRTGEIVFIRGGSGRITYDSAIEIPPKAISRRLIAARIKVNWERRFGVSEFYGIGRSIRVRSVREKFRDFINQFLVLLNER